MQIGNSEQGRVKIIYVVKLMMFMISITDDHHTKADYL